MFFRLEVRVGVSDSNQLIYSTLGIVESTRPYILVTAEDIR